MKLVDFSETALAYAVRGSMMHRTDREMLFPLTPTGRPTHAGSSRTGSYRPEEQKAALPCDLKDA